MMPSSSSMATAEVRMSSRTQWLCVPPLPTERRPTSHSTTSVPGDEVSVSGTGDQKSVVPFTVGMMVRLLAPTFHALAPVTAATTVAAATAATDFQPRICHRKE